MKKSLLALVVGVFGVSAFAADLSPSCQEYFKQVDKFIEMSKNNPHMAGMTSTYEAQKKQFAELPKDTQEATCKPALEQLKQVMDSLPKH